MCLFLTSFNIKINAQENRNIIKIASRNTSCEELLKLDNEYIIMLNGIEYKDGDKAYICQKELDVDVLFLYADTKKPVVSNKWNWTECDCVGSNPLNHMGILRKQDITNNEAKIKVKFVSFRSDLPKFNKEIDLELDIFTDIRVMYSKNTSTKDNFDENKLPYPTQSIGPALYIPYGLGDNLLGDAKPKDAFQSITIKPFDQNGTNELPNFIVTPNKMATSSSEVVNFNLLNNPLGHKKLAQIHSCQKDLVVYTRERRSHIINVFNLCETDDDEQTNLGAVLAATDVCVSPGPDGTLDEYASLSIGGGTRWVHKDDEVVVIGGVKHVVAGPKLKNGKPFCNTEARLPKISCPNYIDFTAVMDEVKLFYTEKANIELTFNLLPNVYMNFDSRIDDDKMDGSSIISEARDFREFRFGNPIGAPIVSETFIVKGVIGTEPGSVAFAKNKVMWVQDINTSNTSLIWAHEIGHQNWTTPHPEDMGVEGDLECFMRANIMPSDKLSTHRMNFHYLFARF